MTTGAEGQPTAAAGPRPICFIVMPFRRRKVEGTQGPGAPGELDCDALWDKVLRPTILELGYLPIRADADSGSVIVKDMFERLAQAHLVIADVTLPNGNVYYEVGLRHVARETGCVLVAASWSKQLFDIDQFRSVRYPLAGGDVPDDQVAAARAALLAGIPRAADSHTPWHELLATASRTAPAYVRDQYEAASAMQARIGAVRLAPKAERADRVSAILAEVAPSTLAIPEIAGELLVLARDHAGWRAVLDFVQRLPEATRRLPVVEEQRLLAQAEAGEPLEAIARLEQLMAEQGETPERHGLVGGRYKRLWRASRSARQQAQQPRPGGDERRYLNKAIDHYTRGMELDYNQYYCSSNLPALLRERNGTGDAARAAIVDHFVLAACDRALRRGEHDEWLRPTLLGAAFRAGDVARADELASQVEDEGAAAWKLGSTMADLRQVAEHTTDADTRAALTGIVDRLAALAEA